jgi:serine/threonine-protein kinase
VLTLLLVLTLACSAPPQGADQGRGTWFLVGAGVFAVALVAAGVLAKLLTPPTGGRRPARIGPYRLVERLGAGGTGASFEARRGGDPSAVVVKVCHAHCLDDPTFPRRFTVAATAAARLDHPHLARVLDHGRWRGRPYLVAELVAGQTLRRRLIEGGALPVERSLSICRDVARGLDHAHGLGVVHGNLTPENIVLARDQRAVVTDFGVARFEEAAVLADLAMYLTTPTYLAPEVMADGRTDRRRDLYALGLVLCEMLLGSLPFADVPPEKQLPMKTADWLSAVEDPDVAGDTVWGLVRDLVAPVPEVRLGSAALAVVRLDDLIRQTSSGPA